MNTEDVEIILKSSLRTDSYECQHHMQSYCCLNAKALCNTWPSLICIWYAANHEVTRNPLTRYTKLIFREMGMLEGVCPWHCQSCLPCIKYFRPSHHWKDWHWQPLAKTTSTSSQGRCLTRIWFLVIWWCSLGLNIVDITLLTLQSGTTVLLNCSLTLCYDFLVRSKGEKSW